MPKRVGRAPVVLDPARPQDGDVALDGITLPEAPTLLCDPKGVVMRASPAAVALTQGPGRPTTSSARSLGELLLGSPDDLRLHQADGALVPVRVVRTQVPGTGLHAVLLVDVSDLAQAAEDLRDEQRRLRTVQRVAQIGSWEYDPDTGVTVWSESHYEMLGVRPGEVVPGAQAVLDVVHPDDYEMVASYWANRELDGNPIDIVYRIIRPDRRAALDPRRRRGEAEIGRPDPVHHRLHPRHHRPVAVRPRPGDRAGPAAGGAAHRAHGQLDLRRRVRRRAPQRGAAGDVRRARASSRATGCWPCTPTTGARWKTWSSGRRTAARSRSRCAASTATASSCAGRGPSSRARRSTRLHGTVQDVTEARALERQLRDDRRRLADAQKAAQLGVWEWNLQTGDVVWSDMLHELFGVSGEVRTRYQTYLDLVHPDDRGWVDDLWQQLATEEVPIQLEHRIVRRDGVQRVFRCYGVVVKGPDGLPLAVGTAQDITEQRAAETRMKRSSQRFADLVSLTPVGIGLFDEGERLVDANDALCDLLGMDLEQLRGMTAGQLTHPDDNTRLPSIDEMSAPDAERTHKIPQRIMVRRDGVQVYCELHIALSVQDDGRRFWLIVFQDITERRRTAEALRHQATHDELTGLPNRALVKELLGELLDVAGPGEGRGAVLRHRQLQAGQRLARPRRGRRAAGGAGAAARGRPARRAARRRGCPATST